MKNVLFCVKKSDCEGEQGKGGGRVFRIGFETTGGIILLDQERKAGSLKNRNSPH